jgi:hypothetical protein
MPKQEFEKRVFLGAEVDDATGPTDAMRDTIDLQVLKDKDILRVASASAQDGVDSSDQFRDGEGLENNVVPSGIQARDTLLDSGRTGKQNDGNLRPTLLKRGDKIQTRNSGQVQIEENQVEYGVFRKMSEIVS